MSTCSEQRLVDAHFLGTIDASEERSMREHIVGCEACRQHYRRRLHLAKLDPNAVTSSSEERIGRALGLAGARGIRREQPRLLRLVPVVAPILAVVALLFLVLRPHSPDRIDDGFRPRGAVPSDQASNDEPISVFRIRGDASTRAPTSLARDEELAFSYCNVDGA